MITTSQQIAWGLINQLRARKNIEPVDIKWEGVTAARSISGQFDWRPTQITLTWDQFVELVAPHLEDSP